MPGNSQIDCRRLRARLGDWKSVSHYMMNEKRHDYDPHRRFATGLYQYVSQLDQADDDQIEILVTEKHLGFLLQIFQRSFIPIEDLSKSNE